MCNHRMLRWSANFGKQHEPFDKGTVVDQGRGPSLSRVKKATGRKPGKPPVRNAPADNMDLPFAESVGYQIRTTHRLLQRMLQTKIEPHGITLGMWYFLRALWYEDGLTQRELSDRVGTMEPTTLSAMLIMEKKGLVRRVRNPDDRRKWHIHLTPKGRGLRSRLLPLAREVVDTAVQNLSRDDVTQLLNGLAEVQKSLHATLDRLDDAESDAGQ
jgi:MarR family transcriptional regulator, organic hydroperoxide resistance regulator